MNCNFYSYVFLTLFIFAENRSGPGQVLNAQQIFQKVSPSVVTIYAYDSLDNFLQQGSGVVVGKEGCIYTNLHVLAGADSLVIKQKDKSVSTIRISGYNADYDVLVLKVPALSFAGISEGNSNKVKQGQKIFTIGSPYGLENTISEGIISGLRNIQNDTFRILQYTAPVSSGSSGGAMVNESGKLIGITSMVYQYGQNLNFSVPVSLYHHLPKSNKNDFRNASAEYYNYRGANQIMQGNISQSIPFFLNALLWAPDNVKIVRNLALAYLKNNNIEMAVEYAHQLLDMDSTESNAYFILAKSQLDEENYDMALYQIQKAISYSPSMGTAYCLAGRCYFYKEMYGFAIENLYKAVTLDSTDHDALYFLSWHYYKKNQTDSALYYVNFSIRAKPDYYDSWLLLSLIHYSKKDYSSALIAARKMKEINPYDLAGYQEMINASLALRHYDEALMYADEAIQVKPYNDQSLYLKGLVYYYKGMNDNALFYFRKSLKLAKDKRNVLDNMITIHHQLGNSDSVEYYQKWLKDGTVFMNQKNNAEISVPFRVAGNSYFNTEKLIRYENETILGIERGSYGLYSMKFSLRIFDEKKNRIAEVKDNKLIYGEDTRFKMIRTGSDIYWMDHLKQTILFHFLFNTENGRNECHIWLNTWLPNGEFLQLTPDGPMDKKMLKKINISIDNYGIQFRK